MVDWSVGFFAGFEVQEGVGMRDMLVASKLKLFKVLVREAVQLEFSEFVGGEGVGMKEVAKDELLGRWGNIGFSGEGDGVKLWLFRGSQFGDAFPLATCVLLSFVRW